MNDETLIRALHQIAVVDDLRCLGCGYEHHCSTHGCAIIKETAERLQALTAPQPNEPLTLEALRKMDGEPVWNAAVNCWALVDVGWWDGIGRTINHKQKWRPLDDQYFRQKLEAQNV